MRRCIALYLALTAFTALAAENGGVAVLAEKVQPRDLEKVFSSYAHLKPNREVELLPLDNASVELVVAELGDEVEEGEAIAYFYSEATEFRGKLAELELQAQRQDVHLSATLAKKDFIPRKELADKRLQLEAQELRKKIDQMERSKLVMRSHIKGIIAEHALKIGDFIDDARKHRVVVIDASRFLFDIHLPQEIAQSLSPGKRVTVVNPATNDRAEAAVTHLAPMIDMKSGTLKTVFAIDRPPISWKPGQYIKVLISIANKISTPSVRNESLVNENDESFLYVISQEGSAHFAVKTKVGLGLSDGRFTEVLSPPLLGRDIVIRGHSALSEKTPVKVSAYHD